MAVKKQAVKAKTAGKKKAAAPKAAKKKVTAKKAAARKKATAKKPAATGRTASPARKPAATRTASPARKPAAARTASPSGKPARTASRKPPAQIGPVPGIAPYIEKKGEEYMNEMQVEHFRNILLAWKRSLMEEVDRTVHHMQDDAANFPDPNDRATQESEFSMELRARDRERKLIKKIDESIRHLDSNEFGYCEACGVEIGVKRLEARPTATLCIDCKILDEIREKQMG